MKVPKLESQRALTAVTVMRDWIITIAGRQAASIGSIE
jgi:hypothetical protein